MRGTHPSIRGEWEGVEERGTIKCKIYSSFTLQFGIIYTPSPCTLWWERRPECTPSPSVEACSSEMYSMMVSLFFP